MGRKLLVAVVCLLALPAFAEMPTADVDLGKCTATFKVTDADGNPVYNANVHLKIERHILSLPSFFTIGIGSRDKEVRVATNSGGEVRFEGLPAKPKRPLVFDVSKSRFMNLIVFAPEDNCNPTFSVKLE
jgi:hypothetical protein